MISKEYGSLLVRCFVQTLYRHSCHRDMHDIYKVVSKKMIINNLIANTVIRENIGNF